MSEKGQSLKIFWSWQSDTPGNIGRHFVRAALDEVIAGLKGNDEIDEALRDELHLDSDRQNIPGSPDLARVILDKIDASFVVIADVTAVCTMPTGVEDVAPKKQINSNVAIELGYALRALGSAGILMVMNDSYGGRDELPFDLRAKAGPLLFTLSPGADPEAKRREKTRLKGQLRDALQLCLSEHARLINAAKNVETEVQTPAVTSADWERLGQRLSQACQFLRADSQRDKDSPSEQWRMAGGRSDLCEALLAKAGSMLLKSPKVLETLPKPVAQEPDPLARWLVYLKHLGHHEINHAYSFLDDAGNWCHGGVSGCIPQLGHISSIACETCSALEL